MERWIQPSSARRDAGRGWNATVLDPSMLAATVEAVKEADLFLVKARRHPRARV